MRNPITRLTFYLDQLSSGSIKNINNFPYLKFIIPKKISVQVREPLKNQRPKVRYPYISINLIKLRGLLFSTDPIKIDNI